MGSLLVLTFKINVGWQQLLANRVIRNCLVNGGLTALENKLFYLKPETDNFPNKPIS